MLNGIQKQMVFIKTQIRGPNEINCLLTCYFIYNEAIAMQKREVIGVYGLQTLSIGYILHTIISNQVINRNQIHSLCLGKFYIKRSQEKNLNQNQDSNLGPPDS